MSDSEQESPSTDLIDIPIGSGACYLAVQATIDRLSQLQAEWPPGTSHEEVQSILDGLQEAVEPIAPYVDFPDGES